MDPAYAKGIVLLASVIFMVMRGVHKHRASRMPVAKWRIGAVEVIVILLTLVGYWMVGAWFFAGSFAYANYPAHPAALIAGAILYGWGLWLLHRTNGDLGGHWSPSLALKEGHRLVTEGVYRRIRHPMYLSLLIFAAGQALALPNYVAGPASLLSMIVLVAFRVPAEERMMIEEFGDEYEAYSKRTSRLIPGLW